MDNLEYILGQLNKSVETNNEQLKLLSERFDKHCDSHKTDSKYIVTTIIAVIGMGVALVKLWI